MNLNFESNKIKDLTEIAVDFHEYIKTNKEVLSKEIYMNNLLSKIVKKHRKLPTNVGTVLKSTCSDIYCGICCKTINKNTNIRKLPCHHVYHKKCIDNWLISNSLTCPNCKIHCLCANI